MKNKMLNMALAAAIALSAIVIPVQAEAAVKSPHRSQWY